MKREIPRERHHVLLPPHQAGLGHTGLRPRTPSAENVHTQGPVCRNMRCWDRHCVSRQAVSSGEQCGAVSFRGGLLFVIIL